MSRHSVYALCDPRTGDIRYIGQAIDIHKRYAQHLLYPDANTKKRAWLDELKSLGLLPTLIVLESQITLDKINEREMYWIAESLNRGDILTNIVIPGYLLNNQEKKSAKKVQKKPLPPRRVGNKWYTKQEVMDFFQWDEYVISHYISKDDLRGTHTIDGWRINQENLDFFIEKMKRLSPGVNNFDQKRRQQSQSGTMYRRQ